MSPAPRPPLQPPVPLGPIAADHALEPFRQQFVQDRRRAVRTDAIDRETRCDQHPQPRLVRPLFRRRLVDVEYRLRGELFAPSVVGGAQRVGDNVRQLDRQPRAARLPCQFNLKDRNGFEEQCRATLALTKAGPPQSDERGQSRPALARGNPDGRASAQVVSRQHGHDRRWRRYSTTTGLISGSPHT